MSQSQSERRRRRSSHHRWFGLTARQREEVVIVIVVGVCLATFILFAINLPWVQWWDRLWQ